VKLPKCLVRLIHNGKSNYQNKKIPISEKIHGPDDMQRKHSIRELAMDYGIPEVAAKKQKKALQYGSKIHKSLLKSRKTS